MSISDSDLVLLTSTFREVLDVYGPESFGSNSMKLKGISDGHHGVQLNAWVDEEGRAFLGVNLEGKEYDKWPIATFVLNEIDRPELMLVIPQLDHPEGIELAIWRDAWFRDFRRSDGIAPTPIRLAALDEAAWKRAMESALPCLDDNRDYRGRAKQVVETGKGKKLVGVSPHLQFRIPLWDAVPGSAERMARFKAGRERLQPLYDFVETAST